MNKNSYLIAGLFALSVLTGLIGLFRPVPDRNKNRDVDFNISIPRAGIYELRIFSPISYNSDSGSLLGINRGAETWINMIQKAKEDKNVKGLLLRINSPGGTVSSSQEIYQAMLDFRESGKKIVVSVADICASGAYYISLPADAIIVNPGSLIGSIGVIMNSIEFSELMQKWGISSTTVKSGKYKDIFSSMRKPLADEKTMLQEMIDSTYNQFLDALLQGRKGKCPEAKLRAMADGRIYNGVQAVKNGLADGVGDYSAAKKIIAELCGLDYKNLNIIRYRQDRWQDIVESLNLRPVFGLLNSSPVPQYRYNGIH